MIQLVSTGLLVGIVGFASTFAVVLRGFVAVGASPAEAASGLTALLVGTGLVAIGLSLRTRIPVSIAWSTPGAALLAASTPPAGGFPAAVGAFLLAAALIVICGLWRPFGRAVAAIPTTLANAMLAGILFGLCTAPVRAVAALPLLALPIVVVWAAGLRFARPYAVPLAVVATLAIVWFATTLPPGTTVLTPPQLAFVTPRFEAATVLSLAVPLFIVTMASQNVPGLAVMNANGYRPAVGPIFVTTGIASAAAACFGAHAINLAAITAALCAGPEAHPDPGRRYLAAVFSGLTYLALALVASSAAAFVAASPPLLIEAVAGLALLPSLAGALNGALSVEKHRLPATLTFVTSASGVTLAGIGAPFWGLAVGLTLQLAFTRRN